MLDGGDMCFSRKQFLVYSRISVLFCKSMWKQFWNNRFLLPCNPWGPRGFHGAAQSTPSRFLFLFRVNFEISPSFSSLLPLSQQHCLGPEMKKKYSKIGSSIQSSKLSLRFVWKYFIHGNCILCLYVKMHLCRFFTTKVLSVSHWTG